LDVAVTDVGAEGTVAGVAATEELTGPVPALFEIVTVNVREVPLVNPENRHVPFCPSITVVEHVAPFEAVTV